MNIGPESGSNSHINSLTPESILEQTGFKLISVFPDWNSDPDSFNLYQESLDAFVLVTGPENVVGSFFTEKKKVVLGVFLRYKIYEELLKDTDLLGD